MRPEGRTEQIVVYMTPSQREEIESCAGNTSFTRAMFMTHALLMGSYIMKMTYAKFPGMDSLAAIGVESALKMAADQGLDLLKITVEDDTRSAVKS